MINYQLQITRSPIFWILVNYQ